MTLLILRDLRRGSGFIKNVRLVPIIDMPIVQLSLQHLLCHTVQRTEGLMRLPVQRLTMGIAIASNTASSAALSGIERVACAALFALHDMANVVQHRLVRLKAFNVAIEEKLIKLWVLALKGCNELVVVGGHLFLFTHAQENDHW